MNKKEIKKVVKESGNDLRELIKEVLGKEKNNEQKTF